MKLRDLTDMNKDDILCALGLESRQSTPSKIFETIGLVSLGLIVGASMALLLTPKSGSEIRHDLGERIKSVKQKVGNEQPIDSTV